MSELSLRFEPTDLTAWLWVAVAALILLELTRYGLFGRRPVSRRLRISLAAAMAVVLAALWQSDRFRFDASTHAYACAALALLAAPWLMRGYARTTRTVSPFARTFLIALRLAAAGIVLLIAAGPVLQRSEITYEKPVLGIAVDDSRSMSIRDAVDPNSAAPPVSRRDAVTKAVASVQNVLGELAATLDVQWFTFDARTAPADPLLLKAAGNATAIGDSVREVRTALSQTQRRLVGIVVISDGCDNASIESRPETSAADAAAAGIPLYTVGVGSETPLTRTRSLLARRLDVPERATAHSRLPARAEFLAVGLSGHPIEFELLLDATTIEKRTIEPAQSTDLQRIDMNCTPAEGGLHRVTVRARTQGIEKPVEIYRFVQITDDKIQVLYIDRPRYERAAVTRALNAAEELQVTRTDLTRPANGTPSPLPQAADGWRRIHVVLIGDVEATAFPHGALAALADAVGNGTGLAMMGGLRSLGGGDYARTPLQPLLPIDLGASEQLTGPQIIMLTPAGQTNPICRLAADPVVNEKLWRELPAMEGASKLDKLTAASEVLLQTPDGQPLLVVGETGAGRSAVVGFDSTWQWAFADDRGIEYQRRFWRQLVLWLANRKPDIWVNTDRPEYDLAELQADRQRVRVRAGITDMIAGTSIGDASLSADLEGPDGTHQTISLAAGEKEFAGEVRPASAGDYRIKVVARSGDKILGQSQTAFVVTAIDRELADPLPDLQLLRRMAAETQHLGGIYVPITNLDTLLRNIAAAARPTEIRHVRRWNLVYDYPWPWYFVFITILTLEWVIRRGKGLV